MSQEQAFYSRKFLNNEERGGIAFVEAMIGQLAKDDKNFDAELKIGDCSRVITLDFGIWDKDQVPNMRQKIINLRRVILAFEAVFIAQLEQIERAQ